ncbi:hypothetical protein [Amycolatopsis sp. NPDC004079]|uniref:hypothetical protein n=1 Tax=Amycolatopsis sp. NPDC004079 TaxID=3154549 RepID=UPI0033ABCE67
MLPALADLGDLEARLGLDPDTLAGPEKSRAQAALDDASALVREETRQDWVDPLTGEVAAPAPLVRVVLGAALRTYRNPDAEISQTLGPFARTLKAAEVGVYLTPPELAIVRRYRKETTGLWTQGTTRGEHWDSTLYAEDQFGCELFPVGTVDKPWL